MNIKIPLHFVAYLFIFRSEFSITKMHFDIKFGRHLTLMGILIIEPARIKKEESYHLKNQESIIKSSLFIESRIRPLGAKQNASVETFYALN